MGNEQDRDAAFAQAPEDLEEPVGVARREHAGGFVEDQDARPPAEGLQDLDPLLQSHGQVPDHGIRIDLQTVAPLELE